MKKFWIVVVLIVLVVGIGLALPGGKDYDYLRIHIRANSNSAVDQNVKYVVKDKVVEFLTPYFANVPSKDRAIEIVSSLKPQIEELCRKTLMASGFSYSVNVKIANEYFPTRTYANTTLESGYYDAVIVELGTAEGDNWWCVMYPPLCFVNKNETNTQIKFKSRIVEWLKSLFS